MKTIPTDFPPTIVGSRVEIAGFLADLRYQAGLTGEEFDDVAGWADRYIGKLECGMRQGFVIEPGKITVSAMADVWLQCLGARLVLMTIEQADAVGAVPCPPRSRTVH